MAHSQATLYRAAQRLLTEASPISEVSYSLPNKHYMPVNLSAFGLENGKGRAGMVEVFEPVASPSGLIQVRSPLKRRLTVWRALTMVLATGDHHEEVERRLRGRG